MLVSRESRMRAMGLRSETAEWRVPATFPDLPESELDQQSLERLAAEQRLDLPIARRELEVSQRQVPLTRLAVLEETVLDVHFEREPSGEHTKGPGIELGQGSRACVPGDTTPPGTVKDGFRKVVNKTPFGNSCRWEAVK